ncbi:hypothetical protein [Williamsia sp. DF01-3]|uniref:hypothetical protein n=1 Tax=Williamsia sp. DF01-3 TaxID=2934157 RepID=UPI001FF698D9|nr:hypothetical protein [Williamsia sp. DF01-3]MCK0517389.1 hypothetical protein [Williamsia sp. DF01-3]
MTSHQPSLAGPDSELAYRLPRSYRGDWQLYIDWCTAFDLDPIGSSPITTARYLAFEPGLSRATLRRRVSAINTAHRLTGRTPPGTITAVRALLSTRERHQHNAVQAITRLPTHGWPAGLFGRRDALILTLVCQLGVPVGEVGELRCGDIAVDPVDGTVHIGRHHHITAAPNLDDRYGLYAVWTRWALLRDLTLRRPSPLSWAPVLHQAPARPPAPSLVAYEPADSDAVLLPAFDRWGNPTAPIGDTTTGLSPRAVSAILHTHLRASGRPVTDRGLWAQTLADRHATPTENDSPAMPVVDLPDTYDDGVSARHRATADLGDLDDIFTALDQQTAELLARTEHLLSQIV